MKIFLYFVYLSLLVALSVAYERAEEFHKACVDETGVDEALITKVNVEKVFEDDEKLKCYVKCLMKKFEIITDDGIIDPEVVIAVIPEEIKAKATPVIRNCGTKVGANACENAWLTNKCYLENGPDEYLLI